VPATDVEKARAEAVSPDRERIQRFAIMIDGCLDRQRPGEFGLRPDALGAIQYAPAPSSAAQTPSVSSATPWRRAKSNARRNADDSAASANNAGPS
jgi:hypothetical protein